jgi:hypothetical protein
MESLDFLNEVMISDIIYNFTTAVGGAEYFLIVFAFFVMLIVVYLIIDNLK